MNKKILAFIYNKEKKKFLILKTNGDEPEKHGVSHWFTVTGSVEKNEFHEQAVKREIKEETNLDTDCVFDLKWGCRYNWQGKTHEEIYFIAFVNSGKINLDNIEVVDYRWLNIDDFVKLIDWDLNKEELIYVLREGLKDNVVNSVRKIEDYTT